jgi:hypothetical protein
MDVLRPHHISVSSPQSPRPGVGRREARRSRNDLYRRLTEEMQSTLISKRKLAFSCGPLGRRGSMRRAPAHSIHGPSCGKHSHDGFCPGVFGHSDSWFQLHCAAALLSLFHLISNASHKSGAAELVMHYCSQRSSKPALVSTCTMDV